MIKTLLFDFGDVFLNLDKEATFRELKKLGLNGFSPEMEELNNAYEKGEVTSTEFVEYYHKWFPQANKQDLVDAWNAILLDFPKHRIEFIENLATSKKYQLLLLSNTNEIHIDWVKYNIEYYDRFKNCFEKFYLSHEIGLRKPDAEVFKFVLNENNLNPENLLFVDDTKMHTEAAKKLGIQVWNLNPIAEDITELFNKYPRLL
jgi:putative hydrolase of the HAD superfamily